MSGKRRTRQPVCRLDHLRCCLVLTCDCPHFIRGEREFKPLDPALHEEARKKFNLPDRYVLFVGNLEPKKNLDMLIKAFFAARKRIRISGNDKDIRSPQRSCEHSTTTAV